MCANLATYALLLFLPLIIEKALKEVIYIDRKKLPGTFCAGYRPFYVTYYSHNFNEYQISIICESAEDVSAEVVWLQTCHSVLARPKMRKRKKKSTEKGTNPFEIQSRKIHLVEVSNGVADTYI